MIEDRTFQHEAVGAAREAISMTGRALIVMAGGLGKMLTSAMVWHGFRAGRGLFLIHSNEILDHAQKEYGKVFGPSVSQGLYNGFNKDIEVDIVFATFQTMRENLERFPRDYFAWMTVDETHHSQAETFSPVIGHFDCPRLGITATPDRDDDKDIRDLFGPEVFKLDLPEAIARGLLPEIEYHLMTDETLNQKELERIAYEVIEDGRRVSLEQLNRRLFIRARDEQVAAIIQSYDQKAIIFCSSIEQANHFSSFFTQGATYHSDNFRKKNRMALEGFREGSVRQILVIDSINEGADFPDVGLIVFYRMTNSKRIFSQQLARGQRPGKEKLTVLDFVGNLERLFMLEKLRDEVAGLQRKFLGRAERSTEGVWLSGETFHLESPNLRFHFSNDLIKLTDVLQRTRAEFYPTWQEAGEVARNLGIKNSREYWKGYWRDPRLPSGPATHYADFPTWGRFLETDPYPTWQEASRAAIALGIQVPEEYRKRYKEDKRLPSTPGKKYNDFPSWPVFLGRERKNPYPTWQEASEAAQELGIVSFQDYVARYTQNARLPSKPYRMYPDFPGMSEFLGK